MSKGDIEKGDTFVKQEGLSVFGASLAIISTIIGGGIISVPYAFTAPGFSNGLVINLAIIGFMLFTTYFYLKSKDYLGFSSISELSYICFGRASVFMINFLIAFVIFGILTLYMLLFSRIAISLAEPYVTDKNSILMNKVTYIALVSILTFPFMMKRNLAELKFQSHILCAGVITLLMILTVKQFQLEQRLEKPIFTETEDEAFAMERIVDSVNILLTSYGFVINLFPISNQLETSTNSNMLKSVILALGFCFGAYLSLTWLCINIYGERNIKQSIFDNLKEDQSLLSVVARVLFLIIFLCNIPYLFFPGKMSLINAILEYHDRSLSKKIEKGMNYQKQVTDDQFQKCEGEIDDLEEQSEDVCDDTMFNRVCITFLSSIVLAAIYIDDLTLVFGMIAAFSETMLNFVFPGTFFIVGLSSSKRNTPARLGAMLFTMVGFSYFFVSNSFNIKKFLRM